VPSRTRVRRVSAGIGKIGNDPSPTLVDNLARYDSITDLVAKGDGFDLDIRHISVTGCVVADHKSPGSITGVRYRNVQPEFVRNWYSSLYSHGNVTGRPTNAQLAADLLAKTNPSRPVVDLPIAVYELREIPDLLRKEGGNWLQKLASLNLKYHFGIKPLINDLFSLLSFSDEVNKRQKELDALYKSGLRRKRRLWKDAFPYTKVTTVNSTHKFNIDAYSDCVTASDIWGFVEWFPNDIQMMKGDRRALARKAVLGMTIDFATAWEAMPWSWLIDWCSNVGDILIANRNIVGAGHGPVRIMETINTSANCRFPLDPYCSDGTWRNETKTRRTVSHVPISAQLPILSLRQLSILGSIGVTRRVPRSS
jgi:hypothetical protein